jgi:flagellar hook-associated protein 2
MDTGTLVEQLVELRRIPIYRLQNQKQGYQNQVSALGNLRTRLEAFQTAAQALDSANEFASLQATSNNEDIIAVTAGSDAAPGTYDIEVTALAQAQKSVSQGYDNTLTAVGTGNLVFNVGGEDQTLELTEYTSLENLAERINNEIDGVNASIVFDGSETGGYHLVLTGEPGTDSAFTVDASGLADGTAPVFTQTQAATDASLIIDGMAVTASGNHLDGVISGLTLDLESVSVPGTTVHIEVSTDVEGVQEQVKAFVDAYNELFTYLEDEMGTDGKLEGNATARSVGNRMENLMSAVMSGGGDYSMLAQIGIERQQGTKALKFDETKFADALADNYAAVRDLFIEREGNIGKAALVDAAVDELTDSIDGLFKIGTDSLDRRIDNIDDNIVRYERSIENYRTTLERKFLAMESAVSLLQAQGQYLSSFAGLS